MSSIRNAVNRRVHRERAQPQERAKLGLLEKHKDYSARAKDHNKKKATLKSLRSKAKEKNEDEFYYGMLSRSGPGSRITRGKSFTGTVDGDRGTSNGAMDVDSVRLLKTQDMGYLRTARNVAAKEARRLQERVLAMGGSLNGANADDEDEDFDDLDDLDFGGFDDEDGEDMIMGGGSKKRAVKPKKIVFADDVEDREDRILADNGGADLSDEAAAPGGADEEKAKLKQRHETQRRKQLEKLQRRLQLARKKEAALGRAENALELQRARMGKTATAAVGPGNAGVKNKNGQKIKVRERKR